MAAMETAPQTATLVHRGRRIPVRAGTTLRDALRKAGFSPEAFLAARAHELVTDDVILLAGEEIRLIAVISGG
jgi:sulfur carrier protein ThiS